MDTLWKLASTRTVMQVDALPRELQGCALSGDGVADHYGGRTPFTFVTQRSDDILLLERLDAARVRPSTAINLTGGYGTGILGDDVRHLVAQCDGFIDNAVTTNDEFHSPERARLVTRMKSLIAAHTGTPAGDWDVTFTSTGSEAMELALQLVCLDGFALSSGIDARQDRDVIVACHGAWHGWSLGTNQMLDRRQFTEGLPRLDRIQTVHMHYGDIEALQAVFAHYRGRIRAVAVEGILGDGGVIPASQAWWQALFDAAAAEDARIIDDEVLTGLRCGGVLAVPPGFSPDCICMGKGLGFGLFPISAVAWRRSALGLRAGIGVRTFNARPFQAAMVDAGLAMVEERQLFARSTQLGEWLREALRGVARRMPAVFKDVRGQGMFIGMELADGFARRGRHVRNEMLRHGVLLEVESGIVSRRVPRHARVNEVLRLTPPLTISEAALQRAVECIERCATMLQWEGQAQ